MDKKGWFVEKFKLPSLPTIPTPCRVRCHHPDARKFYWSEVNKRSSASASTPGGWTRTEPETEGQEENLLLWPTIGAGSGDRYVKRLSSA